ncbi:MAG: hypothetical protein JWL59_2231 [Chthoniobacteraceae bacterium]|nr:hypothetical protein [Chthoniobacteraceae bacterium]
MNKKYFIENLNAVAAELEPLIHSSSGSALHWNGSEYAKGHDKVSDPKALQWYSMLKIIAEMLDRQDSPVTCRQMDYLRILLFGGMGSLNDLSFDSKVVGGVANTIEQNLNEKRHSLYVAFNANDPT